MSVQAFDRPAASGLWLAPILIGAACLGLLAVVAPTIALGLVLGLAFAWIAFASLAWGLALFTFLTFLEHMPGVVASGVSSIKLAGAVLALSWVLAAVSRTDPPAILVRTQPFVAYAAVALATWALISAVWAEASGEAISTSIRLVQGGVLLFIATSALRSVRDLRILLGAYIAGAAATAVAGLAGGTSAETAETLDDVSRLSGSIGDPNELAALLVPAIVFAGFMLAVTRGALGRTLLVGAFLLCAVALFLTQSRGGIIALGVAFLATGLLAGPVRAKALTMLLAVAGFGVVWFTFVAPPEALSRITNFSAGGGTGRTDLWSIALAIFGDHKLLGVGTGNFKLVEPRYALGDVDLARVDLILDTPKVAHNTYLHVLAELGLVGLLLLGIVVVGSLIGCRRAIRAFAGRRDVDSEVLARGVLVGVIAMLAAFTFISAQYEKQLWLLLGVCTGVAALSRTVSAGQEPELALARAAALADPEYDRRVSEQLVEQLEQRLAVRMDALLAEQERLERRRAAVAAREQELMRASQELEARQAARVAEPASAPPVPAPVEPASAGNLFEAEQRLEQRLKAVTERELALARRAASLALLEQRLAEKEAELEARERRHAEQEAAPRPAPGPDPAPTPARAAAEQVDSVHPGSLTLPALERLVAEAADRSPAQQEEWGYYLTYLRDFSEPDGTLQPAFYPLIDEVFGELAEQARGR